MVIPKAALAYILFIILYTYIDPLVSGTRKYKKHHSDIMHCKHTNKQAVALQHTNTEIQGEGTDVKNI